MERHGNTLSPLIRRAWDGDKLSTMTKNSSLKATGAHISIIAHVTEDELRARLTRTDAANGFANRFLFCLVRRGKLLPFGGNLTDAQVHELGQRLASIIGKSTEHRVTMTEQARALWKEIYSKLSEDRPGLLGAITARAEAQCVRLAMIYAVMDGSDRIDLRHLTAAIAVWEYCEASAAHIFGSLLGDAVADEILRALRNAGSEGITRTAIRDLFGRHQTADRIGAALALLMKQGLARMEGRASGGRPVEVWTIMEESDG
jgi:hypothetical protein